MFTMKSELVTWPCVVSDDLVQRVVQNIGERRRFTISEFACEFPQTSLIVLYEITISRLGYHNFDARWVPKILRGSQKAESCFDFDLFTVISQKWL
jgi:hypothetical protein